MILSACGAADSSDRSGAATTVAQQPASDPAASPGDPDEGPAPIAVVTSTNVYGDIVTTIGGDRVSVTSFISDPAQDPHSYEASSRNQLALSEAALVVENGGGYDDFIDTMLHAIGQPGPVVLSAVDISGHQPGEDGELNEHVWYDFQAMARLANRIAAALADLDPAHAADFTANAADFTGKLEQLEATEATIKKDHTGAAVAITEPVPLYLLDAAGLQDQTPEEFSEAVEEDTDVPPLAMKQTLDLFTEHKVALLVYNAQTTGPATEQVLQAAQDNGIPVVPVTETLPAGHDYVTWMSGNLQAIADALR
jgi:zinc/manganese transport system substrate-binding protein